MKRNYKILVLVLLLAFASCSFTTKTFEDPDKDKLLIQVITYVLQRGHFDPKEINDDFSAEVFADYLDQLDPLKRYFYKSDIEEFEAFKFQLDDQLKEYDISFFNLTHDRLVQRIEESKAIYKEVLDTPFDYSIDEEFNSDYENIGYVKNKKQMKERWRQQLKFSNLVNYDDLMSAQETSEEKKTLTEIEAEARAETLKSIDLYYNDYIDDLDRQDWFSMYINAIVEEFDPHTNYFAPEDKENFNQQMSGKLEGIGARLSKRMDNTKIVELISGGPAWRGNELEVGDIIMKVRQEDEEEPVNIVGMRLDDAIKLIKGPKGTTVILTVKKVDGTIEDISITRDVVEIEETYAKSSIVEKNNRRFGVINLPKFYVDFEDYKSRNAASDIKQEIERLKAEGMEGLVLDLRNNGGGSLPVVVDIAGMFIKEGPIVQVRATGEPKEVLKDKDKSIVWDGPLVIMVNELSASASEILAAAMQDYKRAIVIGSKQTYGKGTVQNFLDLNNMVRNNKNGDLGALKLTTQKFYRINGGSTQLEGVKSDVVVLDRYSFIDVGEKDQKNPLPWDKIDSVDYTFWDGYFDYNETIENSTQRMNANEQLKLIGENAKWIKTRMDENIHSLNYKKYKAQLELNEEEAKRFDKISEYQSNLTFESLPYEKELFKTDTILKEKRDRWHKSLSQDVYVEEAINVLEDLKMSYAIKKVANVKD
ncbi:MAG: tail-specific protease [Xanthomarina sp.]|jgi:carboxyl-terminal processing protease|uniref:carboxy terminal-processing peptidase n=1 Tax=Xanthomarina TaxID=1868329 RepID=UPI000C4AC547|nr:carboxy terminal-processing peptidase [Xanthomarina sp.]MAL23167.1 tail-specific protease [Xanthomarina sp.]MBF60612.1 tail-specific protease [Xanthomarina sp.]MDX1316979.1 carboxy terminal-processing peptidase [Xanthomarina gelatinilytica]HAI17239.1 tail-specific protease [Xanthomarina gelatinilytica]